MALHIRCMIVSIQNTVSGNPISLEARSMKSDLPERKVGDEPFHILIRLSNNLNDLQCIQECLGRKIKKILKHTHSFENI